MLHLLAALSVVALVALPGCCCKKKEAPVKQQKTTVVKKETTTKTAPAKSTTKKSCHDTPKKGCKTCKDSSGYSKQSYLELEAADELLL